jgi:hypothetical protein
MWIAWTALSARVSRLQKPYCFNPSSPGDGDSRIWRASCQLRRGDKIRISAMTARASLDALPLYASDEQIGVAILGKGRAKEWCAIALGLERKGLPQVDPIHRGRYVPAVKQWYDARHGVGTSTGGKADGPEDWGSWNQSKRRA